MTREQTIKAWRTLIAKIDENNERYCAGAYDRNEWKRRHDEHMAEYEKLQPKYAGAYHDRDIFEIDEEFECLMHELNAMGLSTTVCRPGDPDDKTDSYIALDMDECDVWVRNLDGKMRVVLRWNRYGKPLYGAQTAPTKGTHGND